MNPIAAKPGSMRAWLLASRPATLSAAAAPVLVGLSVSWHEGSVRLAPAVVTLLGAGFLQIASNFANDVFDHEKGADTAARLGPLRAVQAGLIDAKSMKKGLLVTLFLALLTGIYLSWVAGPAIIAIGLASMICAVAYTGGPYPLGYHGLGDLFVMIFFGFVAVCGTVFVQLGHVPSLAYLAAVPMGALTTNILVVNNLRDRHTDKDAGKRTLAVRFGRRGAEVEYIGLYLIAYLTPVVLVLSHQVSFWVLASFLSGALAIQNIRGLLSEEGTVLNHRLTQSAKLVFLYGITFAAGLIASAQGF